MFLTEGERQAWFFLHTLYGFLGHSSIRALPSALVTSYAP